MEQSVKEPTLIDASEVARILGVSLRWVSANSRTLPFRVALTPRKIKYNKEGLLRWLDTRPQ
jgi:hypothetical protein